MEMQSGSVIKADNTNDGGNGGKITLTVGGDFTMRGTNRGGPGAVISSSKTGPGTGEAGSIRITVGNVTVNPDEMTITCATTPTGDILLENGAKILANAVGEAGSIKMFAGKNATINGLVSSEGTLGTGGAGRSPSMPAAIWSSATRARSSAKVPTPAPTWCICRAASSISSGSWRPPGRPMSRRSPICAT